MKLGDYLNAINYSKDDLFADEEAAKGYVPFIVNRSLSYFPDTILQANDMNIHADLGKQEQFDYLRHSIRKRRRFSKWLKKTEDKRIESVKIFYNLGTKKALESMRVLSDRQIDEIHDYVLKMQGS
jgi:hypothetical protein|tara:strand:- start:5077 stop:5454 length:378 start_codon:yes stop_codon:yes gene_type:complete